MERICVTEGLAGLTFSYSILTDCHSAATYCVLKGTAIDRLVLDPALHTELSKDCHSQKDLYIARAIWFSCMHHHRDRFLSAASWICCCISVCPQ